MNQAQIRDAMRSITSGVGRRKGGGGVHGAQSDKLRTRLVEALTAGQRSTGKAAGKPYNAAETARMAARLVGIGGAVPVEVAARYSFGACIPGLRALAEAMGCDANALVAALVQPAAEVATPPAPVAEPANVVSIASQSDAAQAVRRHSARRG